MGKNYSTISKYFQIFWTFNYLPRHLTKCLIWLFALDRYESQWSYPVRQHRTGRKVVVTHTPHRITSLVISSPLQRKGVYEYPLEPCSTHKSMPSGANAKIKIRPYARKTRICFNSWREDNSPPPLSQNSRFHINTRASNQANAGPFSLTFDNPLMRSSCPVTLWPLISYLREMFTCFSIHAYTGT